MGRMCRHDSRASYLAVENGICAIIWNRICFIAPLFRWITVLSIWPIFLHYIYIFTEASNSGTETYALIFISDITCPMMILKMICYLYVSTLKKKTISWKCNGLSGCRALIHELILLIFSPLGHSFYVEKYSYTEQAIYFSIIFTWEYFWRTLGNLVPQHSIKRCGATNTSLHFFRQVCHGHWHKYEYGSGYSYGSHLSTT